MYTYECVYIKLVTHERHSLLPTIIGIVSERGMMIMEGKLVIDELKKGKELANRLKDNLKCPYSREFNRILILQILCSFDKAISLLNSPMGQSNGIVGGRNSRSEGFSDADSKNAFKKRRITEKKTEQVKICVGPGHEVGCLDDGYCWRKYGQKEILGSKYPRAYYRCTHRFSQGCLALKQVQKSDKDPSVFEVSYLGSHSCNVTTATTNLMSEEHRVTVTGQNQPLSPEAFGVFEPGRSENLMLNLDDWENKKAIFRTFSFPKAEAGETDENLLENLMENVSPATSGSGVTCELTSAPTSVANSPTGGDTYFASLDNIIELDENFWF